MSAGNSLLTEREELQQQQAALGLSGLILSLALCQLIRSPLLHQEYADPEVFCGKRPPVPEDAIMQGWI